MPIYEYECKKCGDHFEVEQRMTDDALTTHESCGGNVVKVFSTAGIVFKGSGFHKTDARGSTKSAQKSSESKSSETKPPSTSTQSSSDTSGTSSSTSSNTTSSDTKK